VIVTRVTLRPAILFAGRPRVVARRADGTKAVYGLTIPPKVYEQISREFGDGELYVAVAPMKEADLKISRLPPEIDEAEDAPTDESKTSVDSVMEAVGELFAELQEELARSLDSDAYHCAIDIVEKYFAAVEDELRELKKENSE